MEKEMENEMETVILGNKPFHFAITVSQLLGSCVQRAPGTEGGKEGKDPCSSPYVVNPENTPITS